MVKAMFQHWMTSYSFFPHLICYTRNFDIFLKDFYHTCADCVQENFRKFLSLTLWYRKVRIATVKGLSVCFMPNRKQGEWFSDTFTEYDL